MSSLLSYSTLRCTPLAFCGIRAWHIALPIPQQIELNTGGLCTVYVTRRCLATSRCISLGIVRWCSHSFGPIIPHRRPDWCRHFGRHVPLRTILKSLAGVITISPTTKWLIDQQISRWTQRTQSRSMLLHSTWLFRKLRHPLTTMSTTGWRHHKQGPALTLRNLILSRRESARRRSAVRGLVLPSIYSRRRFGNTVTRRQDIMGRKRT